MNPITIAYRAAFAFAFLSIGVCIPVCLALGVCAGLVACILVVIFGGAAMILQGIAQSPAYIRARIRNRR